MTGTVRYSEEFIKPDGLKGWFSHQKEYDQENQDPPFEEVVKTVTNEIKKRSIPYDGRDTRWQKIDDITFPPTIISIEKEPEIGITVEQIMSCTDITILEASYKWTTKGKAELERAYLLRHDQLTQK